MPHQFSQITETFLLLALKLGCKSGGEGAGVGIPGLPHSMSLAKCELGYLFFYVHKYL